MEFISFIETKAKKEEIFRLKMNIKAGISRPVIVAAPTVNQNLKMLMEDGLIEYIWQFQPQHRWKKRQGNLLLCAEDAKEVYRNDLKSGSMG